jgi:hypothetical protein
MTSIAILVGNTDYRNLAKLDCCRDDVLAMKQLLEATEKYEEITIIENTEADALKSQLRAAIDKAKAPEELIFYFTGHGFLRENEFYHCAINFESSRPNETGISTTELHTLLRLADARLVVKVIDACNSGTLLVKSDGGWVHQHKDGFKNLIQIASCLDSQNSLTGNPLSVFTAKFRDAALRKTDGVVFYTDIINTLRDEFIDNSAQTPFFVSQHTGREQFVDDAKRLDGLRKTLEDIRVAAAHAVEQQHGPRSVSLLDRLTAADAKVVKPGIMASFVANFFDDLIKKVSTSEFAEFFDLEHTEHAAFEEPTARQFIIRVMANEKRADNFVTAEYSRGSRMPNPLFGAIAFQRYLDNDKDEETWNLHLNCTMARTQLKIAFTPRFTNLQRIVLVVTCAPSLDHCYIFEIATQHLLRDFDKFDSHGPEASRRWWKLGWRQTTNGVVAQISDKFAETVRAQLENAEKRLSKDTSPPSK